MPLHRNSQKRLYVSDGMYFITTNTENRHPYFENEILCELFLETLDFNSDHLEYIKNQPLKHQLAERKWYWIAGEIQPS
jgi:hypothetical protein